MWWRSASTPGTFIDWRYRARDNRFGQFARKIRRAGGLVIPAHPHATCVGCNWKFGFGEADAVEVWNGDLDAGRRGGARRLGQHPGRRRPRGRAAGFRPSATATPTATPPRRPPPDRRPRRRAARAAIQDGIRAGRCWIAESSKVDLAFRRWAAAASTPESPSGWRSPPTPRSTVRLKVTGAPRAARSASSPTRARCTPPRCPTPAPAPWSGRPRPRYAAYVRAEVRHPASDGGASGAPGPMVALTNPIWLGKR